MRTTLIYAGIVGKGFDSIGQGLDSGWINHGLCSIAASAAAAGFEVDLIDLRTLRDWDHFRAEIAERRPTVCGLTMMSVDFNPVVRCVEIIKEVDPSIVTVVGGPHPTLALDEVLAHEQFDHVVTHEGEITFVKLLREIEGRQGGAGKTKDQEPIPRVLAGEAPELDELPFADRDLYLQEWRKHGYMLDSPEVPLGDLPAPFVTVIAGRGCRYNCSFCQPAERRLFGAKVRRRSVPNVIAELEMLREKYHFRSLLIHDDCLTEDRRWVREFCEAYRDHGFRQPFYCQSRADIIVHHEEMVRLMVDVGLSGYFIGFESGSQRMLDFMRKGTTVKQNLEAARICKKYGVKIWANYMLGLPTETKDEIMATVNMLKEIDPDYYSPAFFTPHPGSDLYDYCRSNDLSLITNHDNYRRNPTELKIKGHDYEFLKWACEESQRRTPRNAAKRAVSTAVKRYASPSKVARKLKRVARET